MDNLSFAGDLLKIISSKDNTSMRTEKELKSIKSQLDSIHGENRKKELELLMELDMVHDKNSVLSNLLDIVKDRAEETEIELERLLQESSSPRERSGSRASQASALSGASCGSDEVFQLPPGPIVKDWEVRVTSKLY